MFLRWNSYNSFTFKALDSRNTLVDTSPVTRKDVTYEDNWKEKLGGAM